jgi:predicted esterase
MLGDYEYRYETGTPGAPTLLLLHGTGGDENDLLPLGGMLLPGSNRLSPRGNVPENGMNRFFRRLAEGVFDLEDLRFRTDRIAEFLALAAEQHGFDPARVIAVGYSNGANIAASLLLRRPVALRAAILLHAMVPFESDAPPDLSGKAIFLSAGRNDPIVPPENAARLAEILRTAGADVTLHWHDAGHSLTRDEVTAARVWVREREGDF